MSTRRVSARRHNLTLLVLTSAVLLTGVGSWLAGTPQQRWVVVAHGVGGLLLLLLIRWKAPVVRSGWAGKRRTRWLSALLGVLTVSALLTGVLHSTGALVSVAGQATMWWHTATGLSLVPLLLWHTLSHPQRMRRTDLDRRLLLRSAGLVAIAAAAWVVTEATVRSTGLPGAERRFTGSYPVPRPRPTIWLADRRPPVDPDTWTLTVRGAGAPHTWTLAELRERPVWTTRAVIDCTSGWCSEQEWSGIPLAELVEPLGEGRSVVVRSATGYFRRFDAAEVGRVLLAHSMAGQPLPPDLGAPLRLVVPGRRGFWWVKWVDTVEVDDRPSWWQPVFPLQ